MANLLFLQTPATSLFAHLLATIHQILFLLTFRTKKVGEKKKKVMKDILLSKPQMHQDHVCGFPERLDRAFTSFQWLMLPQVRQIWKESSQPAPCNKISEEHISLLCWYAGWRHCASDSENVWKDFLQWEIAMGLDFTALSYTVCQRFIISSLSPSIDHKITTNTSVIHQFKKPLGPFYLWQGGKFYSNTRNKIAFEWDKYDGSIKTVYKIKFAQVTHKNICCSPDTHRRSKGKHSPSP